MSDRHEKWQRVEPGTVIPAGQPYRAEWRNGSERKANERVKPYNQTANEDADWFIDSSWKPPLVLPTEPTWGIAVHSHHGWQMGQWALIGDEFWRRDIDPAYSRRAHNITDFIPLTDEQVARIEAAQ